MSNYTTTTSIINYNINEDESSFEIITIFMLVIISVALFVLVGFTIYIFYNECKDCRRDRAENRRLFRNMFETNNIVINTDNLELNFDYLTRDVDFIVEGLIEKHRMENINNYEQQIENAAIEETEFPMLSNTNDDDVNECSICTISLNKTSLETFQLECGHVFHSICIKEWQKHSRNETKCPLCNRKISICI